MSMEDARSFCQQRHGDLVSISTKDENVFIWKQVGVYFLGFAKQQLLFIEKASLLTRKMV